MLVNLDPQSSLTGACGHAGSSPNMADVLGGDRPGKTPINTILIDLANNLWLAPI